MKSASLDDLKALKEQGKLGHDLKAPAVEDLGPDFWADAVLEQPRRARSVHLKLDPEVFDWFYESSKGKGHLTRMQAVLRAYVEAKKRA